MANNKTNIDWRQRFIDGGWIPPNRQALHKWVARHTAPTGDKLPYLEPAVQELRHLIETDAEVYMGFYEMLELNPSGGPIKKTQNLLEALSIAVTTPPPFDKDAPHPGLTINNIVSSIVVTESGFATFLNPRVNAVFKKILDAWNRYLVKPDSAKVLTSEEWLSDTALKEFVKYLPSADPDTPTQRFWDAFVHKDNRSKSTEDHWGFQSWDNFFARPFIDIDVTRPLPKDYNDPDVIVSACESTIYNINHDATEDGYFWLKGKEYSLRIMLNNDEFAPLFYGGTVYQAFLDVTDYHRWHSPVDGIVKRVVNVPGTYYAVPQAFYKDLDTDEVQGVVEAQAYLAVAATRALIFIESDNHDIGLVCFIGVGMIEVSSCEITVRAGDRVKKGEQIGTFHFGGSTHCLVFRKGLEFKLDSSLDIGTHVAIRSKIGTLTKKKKEPKGRVLY